MSNACSAQIRTVCLTSNAAKCSSARVCQSSLRIRIQSAVDLVGGICRHACWHLLYTSNGFVQNTLLRGCDVFADTMELSVGAASGLVAVAIAILQFVVPTCLALVLVSVLSLDENAVTWSVVSRSLTNSIWPTLFRSDGATSTGVPLRINLITWLKPVTLFIIAIAAFLTPVGFYEDLAPAEDVQYTTFDTVPDTGIFASGTPPRPDLGFARECGGRKQTNCPGMNQAITISQDADWYNTSFDGGAPYNYRLPLGLVKLYESGLDDHPASVSSFFDIQARQYRYGLSPGDNTTEKYSQDDFKALSSLILDDSVTLIDGLIVDMSTAAVGFRKHTVPTGLQFGAEWDEDILFLTPETSCENLNLTYETQVPPAGNDPNYRANAAFLVDQGGWEKMNITNVWAEPWFEELQESLLNDGDPSLRARAYRAGWWTNVQNMYFFNISKPGTNRTAYLNSKLGERWSVNTTTFDYQSKDQLLFTDYTQLFDGIPSGFVFLNGSLSISNYTFTSYKNPFNISTYNYTNIGPLCSGEFGGDKANMTNLDVRCGLMVGPSTNRDGSTSSVWAPGSWWTRPIYSCASTTYISIKTVRFNYNTSTPGLAGLKVKSISSKTYERTSDMPLWGVETAGFNISDITPLWGLITPSLAKSANLSTIRASRLYLPASKATTWTSSLSNLAGEFMPATLGPSEIWGSAYNPESFGVGIDYSGAKNLALLNKWREMSKNETGAAQILNLIWTDYAANYFTGTRSSLTPRDSLPPNLANSTSSSSSRKLNKRSDGDAVTGSAVADEQGQVPIHVYQRKLRYHWVYGIPATLCLLLSFIILTIATLSVLLGRSSRGQMRHFMYSLSAGRLLGAFLFPNEGDPRAETKDWVEAVGRRSVRLPDNTGLVRGRAEKPRAGAEGIGGDGSYEMLNQKDYTGQGLGRTTAIEVEEGESFNSRRNL
jgi:hypothetical protein